MPSRMTWYPRLLGSVLLDATPASVKGTCTTFLRLRNMTLDVPISRVPVRLFDFNQPLPVTHPEHAKRPRGKKVMIARKPMDVIFPDDLILAIWHNQGEEGFKKLFLPSRVDVRSYWEHVETHCPWFQDHPARG